MNRGRIIAILACWIFTALLNPLSAQDQAIQRSTVIEQYKGKPYYLHFVKKGETLFSIAKAYNVSMDEIRIENPEIQQGLKTDMVIRIPSLQPAAVPVSKSENLQIKVLPAAPPDSVFIYTVEKKETLYGISKKFNVTMDDLLRVNPGLEALQKGMNIRIPVKMNGPEVPANAKTGDDKGFTMITVEQGETIYSITKKHNITRSELLELNPQLSEGLKVDMELKIPARSRSSRQQEARTDVQSRDKQESRTGSGQDSRTADSCYRPGAGKEDFRIAMLLPLATETIDSVLGGADNPLKITDDYEAFTYYQFYAGAMLAADSLEKLGFHAAIRVLDAEKENDSLKIKKALRSLDLNNTDLLIGPLFSGSFTVASRVAAAHGIPIINPLTRRQKFLENNPFVFKVQPSDQAIAASIGHFLSSASFSRANIILVKTDSRDVTPVYESLSVLLKQDTARNARIVDYQKEGFSGVLKQLSPVKHNVILLFSSQKTLIQNFISLLSPRNDAGDITLFGMQGWEDMELETDLLIRLNYHQFSTKYIDYSSETVNRFVEQFRARYKTEPMVESMAFLGYDLMFYFGNALMKYGRDFNACIPSYYLPGLQFDFRFSQVNPGSGFSNADVKIIHLVDYTWQELR